MPLTPINDVFICMPTAMQEEIITSSGLKLYLDPTYRPEQNVSVVGKVNSLPASKKYSNFSSQLNVGDEVAFSYTVVADRRFNDESDVFHAATEGSPYFQKFFNAKEEMLQILAYKGAISTKWIGTYTDKDGELIDGVQGTEHDLERWKSQFNFGGDFRCTFKNLLEVDGVDYWKCTPDNVFAKKVGEEIIAVGDRLILEPIDIDIKEIAEIAEGQPLPFQEMKIRLYDRATLIHDCKELDLKKGDIVSFSERFCEKYELWNKEYFLIKKTRALGVWQMSQEV